MRNSDEEYRPEDPESHGIPAYADDTSDAYDDANHPRFDNPAQLPADEPLAVDEFGTTAEEQRQGEGLDRRLAREEPDIPLAGGTSDPTVEDDLRQVPADLDALGPEGGLPDGRGSQVSEYDTGERPVGRLVQPDAGFGEDTEKDEIALDSGELGGASAEELAMHEVPEDQL